MDMKKAKDIILKWLYEAYMKEIQKLKHIDLKPLAEKERIDNQTLERICIELEEEQFIGYISHIFAALPTFKALVYCEQNGLVDSKFVDRQNEVRIGILEALFDLEDPRSPQKAISAKEICEKANINELEFSNNIDLLHDLALVEKPFVWDQWNLTSNGKKKVKEYRRMRRFDELKKSVNPRERGHVLEDLLEEEIREEGWTTEKRVRQKGAEFDIVFNRGYDYFMVSCKWEKEPIEAGELDVLVMRAMEMKCVAAILVSMSSFTEGCIDRAKEKRPIQQVALFGPGDIEKVFRTEIFQSEKSFSELLNKKIKEQKVLAKILIDDRAFN